MMEPVTIPQAWRVILKQIQVEFPGAVIAGGALRDLLNYKSIKDVDIFIPTSDSNHSISVIERMFLGADIELDESNVYGVNGVNGSSDDRDLYAIYRLSDCNTDYDLILCKPSAMDVSTFDINICQIWYDGIDIYSTEDYDRGIHDKTLRVMNVNRTDRNIKRLDRLKEKYPEFKTVEVQDDCQFF